jgi:DNA uptake protein ComE-like DNA-binding protein
VGKQKSAGFFAAVLASATLAMLSVAHAQAPASSPAATTPPAATKSNAPAATTPQAGQAPAVAPLPSVPPGYGTGGKKPPPKDEKKVDLNNASRAELMTLPSVGAAEADKIIANRPYISKVDLVTKAGLPEGVYVAVRHKTIVNDMKKPAAKKPAQKSPEAKQ